MAVDRSARDVAAQLLRDFISGRITNDQFESFCPKTTDRAIHAIWDTAWTFYDDHHSHKLTGKYRLPRDIQRICVRWILFLHSDQPYEWPDIDLPGIDPATRIKRGLWDSLFSAANDLSAGEVAGFLKAGHYPVWPFISVKDYKQAIAKPRLLSRAA